MLARETKTRGDGIACVVEARTTDSPDRVTPPCPHFGPCGGCALQHWSDEPYAAWKSERAAHALRRAGFTWDPSPPAKTPPAARRRIDLALGRTHTGLVLGLHAARSDEVIAIPGCTILHPGLRRLLEPLRAVLGSLSGLRRGGDLLLNLLDTGPDLLLRHDGPLTAPDRQRLAAFAEAHRIPRIAVQRGREGWETACQLAPAEITFAGVRVRPPPGAFLQASAQGEAAIVAAVLEHVPAKARVLELFAGIGTLTFPLAARGRVTAIEGDAEAAACLGSAALGRVTVQRRDLARQPLAPAELSPYRVVVLDPPFAGAAGQMPAIAQSRARIVYVSCNPSALARDAAVLRGSGFRLVAAHAIDQFLWSPHVETVAVFDPA